MQGQQKVWWYNWFATPQPQPNPQGPSNPYPARPVGPNGTQQFAKLDDKTIFTIVHSYASKGFWHRYYNQTDVKRSTMNIVANLKEIIKEATCILLTVQKECGYTPNEIVGALKRHIWKGGIADTNPAMRMYIVAFGIASIMIEVNGSNPDFLKPAAKKAAPYAGPPQYNASRIIHHMHYFRKESDNTGPLKDMLERLKEYKKLIKHTKRQFAQGYEDSDNDEDEDKDKDEDEDGEEDDEDKTAKGNGGRGNRGEYDAFERLVQQATGR